jgi:hypothetical protein
MKPTILLSLCVAIALLGASNISNDIAVLGNWDARNAACRVPARRAKGTSPRTLRRGRTCTGVHLLIPGL